MARVAVPLVGVRLSPPLPVVALVSRYLTNKLIGRGLSLKRLAALLFRDHPGLPHLSVSYTGLENTYPRVTTPSAGCPGIATAAPLTCMPQARRQRSP